MHGNEIGRERNCFTESAAYVWSCVVYPLVVSSYIAEIEIS